MTKISPAAQAVYEAAWTAYWLKGAEHPADAELIAAAALRALATRGEAVEIRTAPGFAEIDEVIRVSDICAIAAELETQP